MEQIATGPHPADLHILRLKGPVERSHDPLVTGTGNAGFSGVCRISYNVPKFSVQTMTCSPVVRLHLFSASHVSATAPMGSWSGILEPRHGMMLTLYNFQYVRAHIRSDARLYYDNIFDLRNGECRSSRI